MASEIIIGSDFDAILNGARDAVSGAYLNSATVTAQLTTSAGVAVGSPVTCTYVASSNGIYAGVIESTTTSTLTPGAAYYVLFTLASGSVDATFRADFTAQPPGAALIDATIWSALTGVSLTAGSADELAVEGWCAAVSEALTRRCYPALLAPKALTLFPFDAPPTNVLILPRPIRSISAIYRHSYANGDSSVVDTAADLLVANTDYWSKPTDVLTGWNRTGLVYRRNASIWGYEQRYILNTLSPVVDPNRGAIFVSGSFGPDRVSAAVRGAAARAVTLLYNSREQGGLAQSQSWNGGSFSFASNVTAEAAINSPDVLQLLQAAGVGPTVHFG